jgi:hypothetical protein
MARSKVAVLRTSPRTVLEDHHRLMNLAGYQEALPKGIDTALKVNISWHFFYPGSSTTPWQLEGVIRAMLQDGYDRDLLHACHNRTVVIDAHLGERENKQLPVVEAHGTRSTPTDSRSRSASLARTSSTCPRSRPTSSPPPRAP